MREYEFTRMGGESTFAALVLPEGDRTESAVVLYRRGVRVCEFEVPSEETGELAS
ncbi:hypothetical protein [Amycolatopsis magusensis]|uniref:Uncharacterized protein n=1 Tax=Amycolatopsis magusensis TaxID=882444 RepID=A0ABS4PRN1_9PSEU|nr:hypothetical protein [Amycolatopsis magusensis]MBP2182061.1 hypothetical protein [Amycolatopsis magusensis]MDI5977182.1 hypothetical protein [Amycolatopsis magusensis]UJW31750.1 hypothetical protein L3Q67_42385 [Saccharothrix sp. AJ9571]